MKFRYTLFYVAGIVAGNLIYQALFTGDFARGLERSYFQAFAVIIFWLISKRA